MTDPESFVRFCESEFGSTVMDREAAYVKGHVEPDDRVLDVGCGIGSLEERLAEYDIVGLDRSREMVRTARQRVSAPFLVGDARDIPIATDAVDTVVFVATLEFIPELDAVIDETTRVVGPDGTVVALVLNTQSGYVQSNLEREGSYFQRMVHRDSGALAERLLTNSTADRSICSESRTRRSSRAPTRPPLRSLPWSGHRPTSHSGEPAPTALTHH